MAVVNHNFPLQNSMRVVNADGDPIEDVTIRIFDLISFEAGILDTWVAETLTDSEGNWVDPIVLDDGNSWVVHFQKTSEYGPIHMEIVT